MLPLILHINHELGSLGSIAAVPEFASTFCATDAEALVGEKVRKWGHPLVQRVVSKEIEKTIASVMPGENQVFLVPILDQGNALHGLIAHIRPASRLNDVMPHCQNVAENWERITGQNCAPISTMTSFSEPVKTLLRMFDPDIFYDDSQPPMQLKPLMAETLQAIAPAMQQSYLRQITPQAR